MEIVDPTCPWAHSEYVIWLRGHKTLDSMARICENMGTKYSQKLQIELNDVTRNYQTSIYIFISSAFNVIDETFIRIKFSSFIHPDGFWFPSILSFIKCCL